MKSIREAVKLLRLTFRVLGGHPHLLGFVLASALSAVAFVGAGLAPVAGNVRQEYLGATSVAGAKAPEGGVLMPYARMIKDSAPGAESRSDFEVNWPVTLAVWVPIYLAASVVMLFFNVALVASARKAMNGAPTGFSDGLREAWARRREIVLWALVVATIGSVLSVLEQKLEGVARWVAKGVGLGWRLASMLAVPVLVVEGGSPLRVAKRAAELFKRRWGAAVAGQVLGLGALGGALFLLSALGGFALLFLGIVDDSRAMRWTGVGVMVSYALVWPIVSAAASAVISTALYLYATEGVVPDEFAGETEGWFVAPKA